MHPDIVNKNLKRIYDASSQVFLLRAGSSALTNNMTLHAAKKLRRQLVAFEYFVSPIFLRQFSLSLFVSSLGRYYTKEGVHLMFFARAIICACAGVRGVCATNMK